MSKTINDYADNLLQEIQLCVADALKGTTSLKGAIVNNVNLNGTVDVYFPPKTDVIFTNISNQTPFTLAVGDSVELTIKDGSYSNCWVSAKHQATFTGSSTTEETQSASASNTFVMKNVYSTLAELESANVNGNIGDAYGILNINESDMAAVVILVPKDFQK